MIDKSAGWIKIWRKIKNWEWYQDANTFRLFFHLLISVNYEDKKWQGTLIKRGQILTSIRKLSTELKLTVQQTRTALSNLQTTHEITHSQHSDNTQPTTTKELREYKELNNTRNINNYINNNNKNKNKN